jgi:hypothetical protein
MHRQVYIESQAHQERAADGSPNTLAHLWAERVLVPVAAVLARIGLSARARARKRVSQALAEGLTDRARVDFRPLPCFRATMVLPKPY